MTYTITFKQSEDERKFRKYGDFETDMASILDLAIKFKHTGSEEEGITPPIFKVAVFKGRKKILEIDRGD